jgi:hypothetical protein
MPAWAPDGRSIAAVLPARVSDIYIVSFRHCSRIRPTGKATTPPEVLARRGQCLRRTAMATPRSTSSTATGRGLRRITNHPSIDSTDLVADRRPNRIYVRPLGRAADSHRGRRRLNVRKILGVMRSPHVVAAAVQRDWYFIPGPGRISKSSISRPISEQLTTGGAPTRAHTPPGGTSPSCRRVEASQILPSTGRQELAAARATATTLFLIGPSDGRRR